MEHAVSSTYMASVHGQMHPQPQLHISLHDWLLETRDASSLHVTVHAPSN